MDNYSKVIKQLNFAYRHPICGLNCMYRINILKSLYNGEIFKTPILIRQTHKDCILCNNSTSEYNHDVCHECANEKFPIEFAYHHKRC
jgi:hypothetical protein